MRQVIRIVTSGPGIGNSVTLVSRFSWVVHVGRVACDEQLLPSNMPFTRLKLGRTNAVERWFLRLLIVFPFLGG